MAYPYFDEPPLTLDLTKRIFYLPVNESIAIDRFDPTSTWCAIEHLLEAQLLSGAVVMKEYTHPKLDDCKVLEFTCDNTTRPEDRKRLLDPILDRLKNWDQLNTVNKSIVEPPDNPIHTPGLLEAYISGDKEHLSQMLDQALKNLATQPLQFRSLKNLTLPPHLLRVPTFKP